MKIAIDVHSLGSQAGGNETYFRQLLSGLARDRGDDQYILFHTHLPELEETHSDPRFQWVAIPKNPVLRLAVSLPRLLRKTKPDVFHCQYIKPLAGRTPTVVAIHDLAFEHFPEFFPTLEAMRLKELVPWTARRADHIVTVSRFSADDIEKRYGIPRHRITVTSPAASERFHPRDKQVCQEHLARQFGIEGPFILYVGRLQARKNLLRLLEAYARARKRGAVEKMVLVGKRAFQGEQLEPRIRELGLGPAVVLPGYVAHDDLPLFYGAAEIFVYPSLFEGFGLPVLESMASGLPTITSRGSSLEEVSGDAALLADPLDTDSLANALERLLSDAELRRELRERGLRQSAKFRVATLAAQTREVYHSLRRP